MTGIEIEIDGVLTRITDVTPYKEACAAIKSELGKIFADFDPARPERLTAREPELVEYHNRYVKSVDIIARWDDAQRGRGNILEVYRLYREIVDGKSAS